MKSYTFIVTVRTHDDTDRDDALVGVYAALENSSGVLEDANSIWELEGVRRA
jgi:hypothetical protein